MTDPLSEVITLLRPRTVFAKVTSGAGRWGVRYEAFAYPCFGTVLEGRCRLAVEGCSPVVLEAGDFVLMPASPGFIMTGFAPVTPKVIDPNVAPVLTGEVRYGSPDGPPEVRVLGGFFIFDSPDADRFAAMLPPLLHLQEAGRLATLVGLVAQEASLEMPGRDLVLSRLVEVLMIEALRAAQANHAPPGLLRGLADSRLAAALRQMHAAPDQPWSVAELAASAAMSRSAFFERFTRVIGTPPKEYLLAWRMAVARDLLRSGRLAIAEIAERVGYSSSSTFSTAFVRYVGLPPARYARETRMS
jgi:AraC-like DNA-binding protein